MANPNIDRKAAGDNIPFTYDWKDDLAKFGDKVISESHWTVDKGTITIGADGRASLINGTITECYIQGGRPGETAILNNSVLLNRLVDPDSGDKLVRRFEIRITDGLYEPGTPPVVILPDGIPNLTDLAAFRGATPGVSVWVDTTPSYPTGTIYHACPAGTYAADGENVVNGQLVQWVELHHFDGGSGVPLTRRIDTTAPLRGGGDLSANRTLTIDEVDYTTKGAMSPEDKIRLDGIPAATPDKTSWYLTPDIIMPGIYMLRAPGDATITDGSGYRKILHEASFCLQLDNTGSQDVGTITEGEYGGQGNLTPGQWAEITIEITLITMAFDHSGGGGTLAHTGSVNRGTWVAKWSKYSPLPAGPTGTWNHSGAAENTALRYGVDWATDMGMYPQVGHAGPNDGDIVISLIHNIGTWVAGQDWSTANIFVKILGGGKYAP